MITGKVALSMYLTSTIQSYGSLLVNFELFFKRPHDDVIRISQSVFIVVDNDQVYIRPGHSKVSLVTSKQSNVKRAIVLFNEVFVLLYQFVENFLVLFVIENLFLLK